MDNDLKIILTVGIPGCGKTTWTKEFLKNNSNYIRASRDEYRYMLRNEQFCSPLIEALITKYIIHDILLALNNNLNVIIDQTNLKAKYLNGFIKLLQPLADIEFKIFDISLDEAIKRDSLREKTVGRTVIEKMYKDYINLMNSDFDFSIRYKN